MIFRISRIDRAGRWLLVPKLLLLLLPISSVAAATSPVLTTPPELREGTGDAGETSDSVRGGRHLSLAVALGRALAANPRLTAAERDIGIAAGRTTQANALPNPELGLELDNALGSGPYRRLNSAETTLQLSQLIELGGKRAARTDAAGAAAESARWEREALRLEILSDTTIAFVNLLSAQQRVAIFDEQIHALERLTPLLQRRVSAGASAPSEVMRGQTALDLARADRIRARTSMATARRELAALMGGESFEFADAEGKLEVTGRPGSLESILAALEKNPQLARFNAMWAQRDAELLSARLKAVPDVSLGVGWRHFEATNDDGVRINLSMPLPLLNRNEGGVMEAGENLLKLESERAAARQTLVLTLARTYEALNGAREEAELLGKRVVPGTRKALAQVEKGYGEGRFTLLELLDAQSVVTQAELRRQEALANFHVALAALEALSGSAITLTGEGAS